MTVQVRTGDCRTLLAAMPDQSVNCVVTSPPYWGLRDYGVDGQIGLESTPETFVAELVAVFREVRRVLSDDGTLWLNLGDCYATGAGAGAVGQSPGGGEQGARWKGETTRHRDEKRRPHGQPGHNGRGEVQDSAKGYRGGRDLSESHQGMHHTKKGSNRAQRGDGNGGVPFGPMTQPNRMPLVGLKPKDLIGVPWRVAFALQADGWYLRSDIIWHKPNPMPESVTDRPTKSHEYLFLLSKSERYYYNAAAIAEPVAPSQVGRVREDVVGGTSHAERGQHSKGGVYKSGNKKRKPASARGVPVDTNGSSNGAVAGSIPWEGTTRNKRTVWTVNTQPFKEAHFATFPTALIEPCILAGSAEGGGNSGPFRGCRDHGSRCRPPRPERHSSRAQPGVRGYG